MRFKTWFATGAVCLLLNLATACAAQEIHLYGGAIWERDERDTSYVWTLEYKYDLAKHWTVSFSWLNEGHFDHHHRDGHTLQLWWRTNPLWKGIVLAAGIGPYRYFDTKVAHQEHSYVDSHGWGGVLSFTVDCPLHDRWLFSLRTNNIRTDRSIDTFSVMAGIGYRFDKPGPAAGSNNGTDRVNEITAYIGQVVVNSGESEKDTAWSLEYRRNLGRYIDWSVGWLQESDPGPINRYGLNTQLWLAGSFLDDRLLLSVGAGPYLMVDKKKRSDNREDHDVRPAGIVTMSGAYEFRPSWVARVAWHRTVTDYNRDTDIILGGIGKRF
jgi:hypothetical protein